MVGPLLPNPTFAQHQGTFRNFDVGFACICNMYVRIWVQTQTQTKRRRRRKGFNSLIEISSNRSKDRLYDKQKIKEIMNTNLPVRTDQIDNNRYGR